MSLFKVLIILLSLEVGFHISSEIEHEIYKITLGESTLDIQWITAIGRNVPTTFWSVSKGFLLVWVIEVSEAPYPPLVHSISYGEPEKDMLPSHTDRLNQEFQLLGVRGVTIISTSGDIGVSDGTDICNADVPDYPSSSPWTTSLGATYLYPSSETPICSSSAYGLPILCSFASELPCAADTGAGFTTGGGFSGRFTRFIFPIFIILLIIL